MFQTTLLAGVQIFFILFIVFDEIIACLGTDAILSVGRKEGRPVKKRPKLFFVGVFFDPGIASYAARIIFLKDGKILEDEKRACPRDAFYQEIIQRMEFL